MADYVLLPEYKQLKRAGAAMSRKLDFVTEEDQLLREKEAAEAAESTSPDPSQVMASIKSQQEAERVSASRIALACTVLGLTGPTGRTLD